jgi:hypothetical protein
MMLSKVAYEPTRLVPAIVPGLGGPTCQTDNAALTVYRQSSIPSNEQGLIATELGADYNVTDLSVSYATSSTVSYSGSSECVRPSAGR